MFTSDKNEKALKPGTSDLFMVQITLKLPFPYDHQSCAMSSMVSTKMAAVGLDVRVV